MVRRERRRVGLSGPPARVRQEPSSLATLGAGTGSRTRATTRDAGTQPLPNGASVH
jgi:hypothetical protein